MVEVGANYDEEMTPPSIFEKYMLPFYNEASNILHRGGKLMAAHLDGEMRGLLNLIGESGIDVAEAMTPAPQTTIDTQAHPRPVAGQSRLLGRHPDGAAHRHLWR